MTDEAHVKPKSLQADNVTNKDEVAAASDVLNKLGAIACEVTAGKMPYAPPKIMPLGEFHELTAFSAANGTTV